MKASLYFGGKYPNSPMRHRNVNKQTLKELAESLGYKTTDDPRTADIYLSVDYNIDNEEILKARKREHRINILLRSEPRCVLPAGYSRAALRLNDYITTFGVVSDHQSTEFWPQFWAEKYRINIETQRINNRAVLVNANKLNLSRTELYSLRRKCVKKMEDLDLFGDEWNTSKKFRRKVALIEVLKKPLQHFFLFPFHSRFWFTKWPLIEAPIDKAEVLCRYKVSLVIENETSYISEKLFDALVAGCIPVYVGPNVSDYGIPEGLVFQSKPSLDAIREQLSQAYKADYEEHQEKLASWLNSPDTREQHFGESVMARVLKNCIEFYLQQSTGDKN